MECTQSRRFSKFITEIREGAVEEELSIALASLVMEVEKQQRVGSLDLKIKLTPNKGNGTLFVQALVSSKEPKADPPSNIFYVDKEFNLRREDPRQMKLDDLKTVPDEVESTTNIKEAL